MSSPYYDGSSAAIVMCEEIEKLVKMTPMHEDEQTTLIGYLDMIAEEIIQLRTFINENVPENKLPLRKRFE